MLPARAILYHGGQGLVARNIESDENMKEYCANKGSCRRYMLLKHFDSDFQRNSTASLCSCCDVCERECVCIKCSDKKNYSYTVCIFVIIYIYRTCSIICPPRINAPPPLWGLSYCAGFLSRKHAPPPRSDYAVYTHALTRSSARYAIYVCN